MNLFETAFGEICVPMKSNGSSEQSQCQVKFTISNLYDAIISKPQNYGRMQLISDSIQ